MNKLHQLMGADLLSILPCSLKSLPLLQQQRSAGRPEHTAQTAESFLVYNNLLCYLGWSNVTLGAGIQATAFTNLFEGHLKNFAICLNLCLMK
jgi:hypothetical protein